MLVVQESMLTSCVVAPVASATNAKQVYELAQAARVQLTRNQVLDLDRASA